MSRQKEKIVMMDSDEAASIRTLTGWVDRQGRFWGNDEYQARWCGATHRKCKNKPEEHPIHSTHGYCEECHRESRQAKFAEMEIESSVNDAVIIELKQQYSRLQKARYDTKAVRGGIADRRMTDYRLEDTRIKALTDMIPLNEPPSVIVDIKSALVELQERRSADREYVGTVVDVGNSRVVEWERSVPEGAKLFVTPQPVPVVPEDIGGIIRRFQHQCDHLSDGCHIDEHSCRVDRRDLMAVTEYLKNLLRNFSRENEQ